MAKGTKLKSDGRTITVRVPISIIKRGGNKIVLAPDGAVHDVNHAIRQRIDSALVKAIARAFRWREMLENGACATIGEIALKEQINESYVARILRLTLLAPSIIEAIVHGRHNPSLTLPHLIRPFSPIWHAQSKAFGTPAVTHTHSGQ